jgi:hypothetical protein
MATPSAGTTRAGSTSTCMSSRASMTSRWPTMAYGTIRAEAWHGLHPRLHHNAGYFKGWRDDLPVLRGTLVHVTVDHLPDGRVPARGSARRASLFLGC